MIYQIKFTVRGKKGLKKIKILHKNAFYAVLEELRENPYLGKPLTRELKGKYSYKIGLYRIIYSINKKDKVIIVSSAGHRATIYKT